MNYFKLQIYLLDLNIASFQNVVKGSTPLVRSYRYIRLTKRTRQAFLDNLVAAFNTIDHVKEEKQNKKLVKHHSKPKKKKDSSSSTTTQPHVPDPPGRIGLTGTEFIRLIKMLCV